MDFGVVGFRVKGVLGFWPLGLRFVLRGLVF